MNLYGLLPQELSLRTRVHVSGCSPVYGHFTLATSQGECGRERDRRDLPHAEQRPRWRGTLEKLQPGEIDQEGVRLVGGRLRRGGGQLELRL